MTTTPANDNSPRPAEFDARILAHLPMLKRMADKFCHPNDREEIVQEAVTLALEKWQDFRPEGSFYMWLGWKLRQAADRRTTVHKKRKLTAYDPEGRILNSLPVAARQEDIAFASEVVRELSGTRDGKILIRRAMGEELKQIGIEQGIGKERVRQLSERARERLQQVAA